VGFFFGEKCLSIKLVAHLFFALVLASFLSFPCAAQQTPPPANPAPSAPPQSSSDKDSDKSKDHDKDAQGTSGQGKVAGTSNDRLFYTLPNFLTLENTGKLPPLTAKEKFKVVTRGSFDYVQYPWYGFLAGISQAEDSEPGYGQGAQGYGKRFGAAFADGTIENYMTGAILPSLLHQDPRYYQLGQGSFMHRMFYAASRNLITRTDSANTQFNYSEVVGGAMAAAISTYSYHPSADKTLSNTASVWATQYGYDMLTLVVKEFWPDIRRKISSHKHKGEAAPGGNPNQ
jgi:hypothetical protein